jgi:hypothetical protein
MICNVFIKEENSHSQKTPRAAASAHKRDDDAATICMCSRCWFFHRRADSSCGFRSLYKLIQFAAEFLVYSLLTTSELFRCWEDGDDQDIWLERTHYLHIFGFSTAWSNGMRLNAYTAMTAFLKIAAQLTKQRTEYFNIKNALHLCIKRLINGKCQFWLIHGIEKLEVGFLND